MRSFALIRDIEPRTIDGDHGGKGPIAFRRLMHEAEFASPIRFVDYTIVPPKSEIGFHEHLGNDELYLVARGGPLVRVERLEQRLRAGDVTVVRSGQRHGLVNDSDEEVHIFVVEVEYLS